MAIGGREEEFAKALALAMARVRKRVVVKFLDVPENYQEAILRRLSNPPNPVRPITVIVKSVLATQCSLTMEEGGPTVLAEFPFGMGKGVEGRYISAYRASSSVIEKRNQSLRRFLLQCPVLEFRSCGESMFSLPLDHANVVCDGVSFDPTETSLQLPGGEVFADFLPRGNGKVCVDLSLSSAKSPWMLKVSDGIITDITSLSKVLTPVIPDFLELVGGEIVEVGFGTNHRARNCTIGPLFEKELGTWHLGIRPVKNPLGLNHIDVRALCALPSFIMNFVRV